MLNSWIAGADTTQWENPAPAEEATGGEWAAAAEPQAGGGEWTAAADPAVPSGGAGDWGATEQTSAPAGGDWGAEANKEFGGNY